MTRCRFLLILLLVLGFSYRSEAGLKQFPVIVQIAPTVSIDTVAAALNGGTVIDAIPGANTYLLNVVVLPQTPPPGVQWMELNRTVSLPRFGLNGGVLTLLGSTPSDWYKVQPAMQLINAAKASALSTGRAIVIADLNSKIDYAHPALAGHLTSGYDFFTSGVGAPAILEQADAGFLEQADAGFLEQADAGFLEQADAGFLEHFGPASLDGLNPADIHGSLSAGIIAAIAPDSMIMPLHAFGDDGRSDLFTLAKAIRYGVDHGAQIINLNFGTLYISLAIQSAVQFAQASNVILVAPAGNGNPAGTSQPEYPAAFTGVMTAAATDFSDKLAVFSNYGSDVFVTAPGVGIISAYPGGYYTIGSGTTLSAAAVAGTAALVRSLRTNGVSDSIARGAVNIDSQNPNFQNQLGRGRIDVLQSVQPPTTTSITASTVTYNDAGIVTVTVTSPGATPSGSVSLKVDGGTVMSAALSNSPATFTINGLNAGDHTLTASYAAQGAFAASSATGTLHVNPRPITAKADPKSKTYGIADPILTYQITSGSLVNGDNFTGSLTRAAGQDAGTYAIQQGTLALSANYTLTYAGADLTITPAPTETAISSATNPSTFGQGVVLTATVNSTNPGAGIPPGTVTFYDGVTAVGTSTLNVSGVATFSTSGLAAGAHAITAAYGATSNFSASTSSAGTQTVNKASTSTTLASGLNPSSVGTAVTFTAVVNAASPGAGIATGTITFTDGTSVLDTVAVNGSGRATLMTSSLTVGVHSITAVYNGDSNFILSTSAPVSQIIYAYPADRDDGIFVPVGGGSSTFVIGDRDAVIGKQVTFWSAQWHKLNSLSGGSAPASFKGFAYSTGAHSPKPGDLWTSEKDDRDSAPPRRIPSYMAVIVSSSITKSDSTIKGNISRIVVVETAPGYRPDPGHAGTGKVVAIIAL